MCTCVCVQVSYGVSHREHTCVYIYILVKGTIMRRCIHLYLLHYFCKKVLKIIKKERKYKVTFRKGAYDIRTMQPSWFETVYLREKDKKKYPDFFLKMEVICLIFSSSVRDT